MDEVADIADVLAERKGRPPVYNFHLLSPGYMMEIRVPYRKKPERFVAKVRNAASTWRQRNGVEISFIIRCRDQAGEPFVDKDGKPVIRIYGSVPVTRGRKPKVLPMAPGDNDKYFK